MDKWNATDVLKFSVKELVDEIEIIWIAKCVSKDYDGHIDFDEEVEGDSKKAVIDAMVDKLAYKFSGYPEEINLSVRYSIMVPLEEENEIWSLYEFTRTENIGSLSKYDVQNLPQWQEKVVKAKQEKEAAEKAKREAEQKQWKEDARRRDLATYERIKKELENGNV